MFLDMSVVTLLFLLPYLAHLIIASPTRASSVAEPSPLPLVIWHGLGDDFAREGLMQVAKLAAEVNPGTYVHIIRLGSEPKDDREASFFGNLTTQLETVCEQLASDPVIGFAPAINALGFSQGGQFLRGYVERCNNPPVRNLVTFGSQHNGIAKFQACAPTDWFCLGAEALLRFGVWSDLVQSRLVPAQYFRDSSELDLYLKHSNFLADINNERTEKNEEYRQNMITLNKLVSFVFEEDKTVVPKESAHFADFNSTTGKITPLWERDIYKFDWLGLKVLNEAGKLEFLSTPGEHMQLSVPVLKKTFETYFGPVQIDGDADTDTDSSLMLQVQ